MYETEAVNYFDYRLRYIWSILFCLILLQLCYILHIPTSSWSSRDVTCFSPLLYVKWSWTQGGVWTSRENCNGHIAKVGFYYKWGPRNTDGNAQANDSIKTRKVIEDGRYEGHGRLHHHTAPIFHEAMHAHGWSSVWSDLIVTYERVLQLKQAKRMRTFITKDMKDLVARKHLMQIQREQSNRKMGFHGI